MIIRNSIHDSTIKRRKYSIEEIKSRTFGEPFELLSTEYVNAHEKLLWKCGKCGETWWANWHNISFGKGCRNCRKQNFIRGGTRTRYNIQYVRSFLKNKQIILTDNEYINAHTKLNLVCEKCGNEWRSDFHHLKGQNTGCPKCSIKLGDRHWKWRGHPRYMGYPREWSKELRESIRNRDERKCRFPNCTYSDVNHSKKLHVHHINGDKSNCRKLNLISLCNKHHMYIEGTYSRARSWEDYFYSITLEYKY